MSTAGPQGLPDSQSAAAEALLRQASALARQGAARDAARIVRVGLQRAPADAALISNFGSILSACQHYEEAFTCFARAIDAAPEDGRYHFHLATAQRALGDLNGAEQSCDEAIRLDPRHYAALWFRAGLRKQTAARNHIDEIESRLAADDAQDEDRVLLRYALAKELEDLGQYSRSFEHLRQGASAYRQLIHYDLESDLRTIDCLIETHTKDFLRVASQGHPHAAPIFIVGLPRSGTALVERMLQGHPDIVCVGERNDFALELMRLTNPTDPRESLSRESRLRHSVLLDMRALGLHYIDAVQPENAGTRRLLDTMPINYLYCGLILTALPKAKIISIRREPMDACYAAYKTFLTGPYGFSYDLDELGRYYLAYRKLIEHWQVTLPPECYLDVRYEAVVANFESETRRVLAFCGLATQAPTAPSHRDGVQVRQPIDAASVGRWHQYREQLRPLAERLGQDAPVIA